MNMKKSESQKICGIERETLDLERERERERDTCLYNFDFEIKVSKGEARLWESAREGGRHDCGVPAREGRGRRDCKGPPVREGGGRRNVSFYLLLSRSLFSLSLSLSLSD